VTKRHLSVLLLICGAASITAGVWLAAGLAYALIVTGILAIAGELLIP